MTGREMLEFGKETLRVESSAIQHATDRLGISFINALQLLENCTGKVITTGVGKSGIAAHKIAATLTSTGCPAVYLHPSDAVHGDLGIVSRGDVLIILSNSGESEELNAILPALLVREVPIIAIVGNRESTLANRSHVVLDASIEREACPLNLAPTTSVVVAIAIGDALAMTLQKLRGLTADDYAMNHPGGRLGRRLTLRVCDVMPDLHGQPVYVEPSESYINLVSAFTAAHMGAIAVQNEDGPMLGMVAESDIRRGLLRGIEEGFHLTASDIMNATPAVTLYPDQLAYESLQLMTGRARPVSVAPVLNRTGRCVGMLRVNDLVQAGL